MVKYCCSVELSFVLATSLAYTGTDTHTDRSCCFLFCLFDFYSWNEFILQLNSISFAGKPLYKSKALDFSR